MQRIARGVNSVFGRAIPHYVAAEAEKVFKAACVEWAGQMSPQDVEVMCQSSMSLEDFIAKNRIEIPQHQDNPGVAYLQGCTNNYLLQLMQTAIPEHSEVLAKYPEYLLQLIKEFKELGNRQNSALQGD